MENVPQLGDSRPIILVGWQHIRAWIGEPTQVDVVLSGSWTHWFWWMWTNLAPPEVIQWAYELTLVEISQNLTTSFATKFGNIYNCKIKFQLFWLLLQLWCNYWKLRPISWITFRFIFIHEYIVMSHLSQ